MVGKTGLPEASDSERIKAEREMYEKTSDVSLQAKEPMPINFWSRP